LQLLPGKDWDREFYHNWTPGETGGLRRLADFCSNDLQHYAGSRDYPAQPATSRLSAHLHFGEIAPRRVVSIVRNAIAGDSRQGSLAAAENLLRELVWREFAHHVLYHFPHTTAEPMNSRFDRFPWREPKPALLHTWCRGRTGYPLVDAGMRELWATGTMHNRVRMIAASFLTKNCMVHWRYGARWFWDTLVDADLASNSFNWQWVAGSGADAAPYFRIFNPLTQSEKFDAAGTYLRRWLPELQRLPDKWLHRPWQAPPEVLDRAGVHPGHDYPLPLVDLKASRDEALSAYRACMQG
jgi:deoxyribodipyrimidine photo-lyase